MKTCDYCNKEISYYDMYCSDDCQKNANDFYDLRDKYTKMFAILNGIFVLSIGIGIFAFSLIPALGAWMITISLLILGILYFFLPFPPELFLHKYKIKKSIKICKIIAIILFVLGVTALILTLTLVK